MCRSPRTARARILTGRCSSRLKNPRVLLIDAVNDYRLPSAQGGNKERALTKLRNAVAAFETERRRTGAAARLGRGRAYFFLGRDLMDHGDACRRA